jgi:ribosome-associated protein
MDLPVGDMFVIPESELEWSFSTPGGPGGQHANRNATRAELSWNLGASPAVSEQLRTRLVHSLGSRVRDGVITLAVSESRSQWRNRQMARRRLAETLEGALRERRRRVPTRPSRSSRDARIKDKRRRGADKRLRKPPEIE